MKSTIENSRARGREDGADDGDRKARKSRQIRLRSDVESPRVCHYVLCIRILYPNSTLGFSINPYSYQDSISGFRILFPDLYSVSGFRIQISDSDSGFVFSMRILCPDSVSQFRIRKSIFFIRIRTCNSVSVFGIWIMYPDSAFGFSINPYSVTGFRIPYPYLVSKSVSKERLRDFTPILALRRTFVYIFFPVFMNLKDKKQVQKLTT